MEAVKRWIFKNSNHNPDDKKVEMAACNESKVQTDGKMDPSKAPEQQISPLNATDCVDPNVAEFFKEFPEPYRQRLIERYSSREGIYRFDFIRKNDKGSSHTNVSKELAMKREYDFAAKGVLLEERRERAEYRRQLEEEEIEKRLNEHKESLKNRQVPEWEKSVQTLIPLQQDETMGLKLFQTLNMSVLGLVISWAAIRMRKTQPSISKVRYLTGVVGSLNLCAFCQVAAVYRLMDWGLFDRTFDDRDAVSKTLDIMKKSLMTFKDSLNDNKPDT